MTAVTSSSGLPATIQSTESGFCCRGQWTVKQVGGVRRQLASLTDTSGDQLDGSQIEQLDTVGALLLDEALTSLAEKTGRPLTLAGLRSEHQALLDLVRSRREQSGEATAGAGRDGWLVRLGKATWGKLEQGFALLSFIGEAVIALARLAVNPGRFRWKALFATIETAGVSALPIVALLSFLMGVVIAYQGGVQLKTYGANIFIVELVTLTMIRELAPLVTAIVVAGRTGSAFTAQIGTMRVTEEVDALATIGITPMDLLVVPKLLALMIALPLLTLFADVMSIFGGMVISLLILDVSFYEFVTRIPDVVLVTSSFAIGIGKAPIFAAIIALVGCYQGFQVSGGADAVGRQTTVSVVQAIFLVILADALFSVLFSALGL